jgi:vacuolar protein sorting-associated protein 45
LLICFPFILFIFPLKVYLFERIDAGAVREPLKYLKCVAFLRSTPENIQLLARELHSPRYAQYYVYFSNVISKSDVKTLAEADEHECVREMHEFYCDFVALLPHLFTLNIPLCYTGLTLSGEILTRCIHALAGVLLSLKRTVVIRYESFSPAAKACAEGAYSFFVVVTS